MLRVSGLKKRYGDRTVLDGVDLEVPEGAVFGFIGPNGAGKTTTMRAVMGVLTPDAGSLTWRGAPLDRATRRRFGYMPEERGLYQKMPVAKQVEYFGRIYGLDRAQARRSAASWIERLELSEHRHQSVQSLSLGNQQRVQLAVALVHDPDLLVLDEPFSGLDPLGVEALSEVLREKQAAGVPILFSSHQLDLVERLIDSVGMIRDGRMVVSSSAAEARRRAEPRLRIRLRDAPPGWSSVLPAPVVAAEGDDTVLVGATGGDLEPLLKAAMSQGVVEHFGWDDLSLTDVFQQVMA